MESLIPDPVRLIKLALEFKELLERIGENDEECRDIWNLAQSTGSLVMKLQEERPDLIHDTVMANVLLGVESALIWASDIVEKQRKQGTLRKYTSSKTMARNFRRARDRIDSHIDMLNAAINIHNLVDVRQKHYSECPLLQFEVSLHFPWKLLIHFYRFCRQKWLFVVFPIYQAGSDTWFFTHTNLGKKLFGELSVILLIYWQTRKNDWMN